MGLIKRGMTLGAGYYMVKKATAAVEKHDQAKMQYNPQHQQAQQQPPQQSSRAVDGRQTYGKYIAPDGTEHVLYEPWPQLQAQQYQQPQPQFGYQASRGMENQTREPQSDQPRQGSRSPSVKSRDGYLPPTSTTPPPYHPSDRKN